MRIQYVHIIIEINTLIATSSRVCYTVEYIIDVMHLSLCHVRYCSPHFHN